jgi:hypothetical protein
MICMDIGGDVVFLPRSKAWPSSSTVVSPWRGVVVGEGTFAMEIVQVVRSFQVLSFLILVFDVKLLAIVGVADVYGKGDGIGESQSCPSSIPILMAPLVYESSTSTWLVTLFEDELGHIEVGVPPAVLVMFVKAGDCGRGYGGVGENYAGVGVVAWCFGEATRAIKEEITLIVSGTHFSRIRTLDGYRRWEGGEGLFISVTCAS